MKILLVIKTEKILENLSILNPELKYCAIVVDNVEPTKEILKQLNLSNVPLYPMEELKTCAENLNYDYVLVIQRDFHIDMGILKTLQEYNLPTEKVISFKKLQFENADNWGNWQAERQLRYYRKYMQNFEIFATGISHTEEGIDIREFKHKTFNFGTASQDLYYSFQIAKFVVLCGGGHSTIRYALIGLAPYVFHYDLSQTYVFKSRILPYLIAFNDIHNFPVPIDIYKNFFREEWLTQKPSIQKVNINGRKVEKVISQNVIKNGITNTWNKKFYPETRDENVKILDDYLTLCKENNIRPIMDRVPVTEKYMVNFNKTLLDKFDLLVEQALQKHPSARFVDGWKWNGVTYADFRDHEHLNKYGAAKFSAYLNDFIEKLEQKVQ